MDTIVYSASKDVVLGDARRSGHHFSGVKLNMELFICILWSGIMGTIVYSANRDVVLGDARRSGHHFSGVAAHSTSDVHSVSTNLWVMAAGLVLFGVILLIILCCMCSRVKAIKWNPRTGQIKQKSKPFYDAVVKTTSGYDNLVFCHEDTCPGQHGQVIQMDCLQPGTIDVTDLKTDLKATRKCTYYATSTIHGW